MIHKNAGPWRNEETMMRKIISWRKNQQFMTAKWFHDGKRVDFCDVKVMEGILTGTGNREQGTENNACSPSVPGTCSRNTKKKPIPDLSEFLMRFFFDCNSCVWPHASCRWLSSGTQSNVVDMASAFVYLFVGIFTGVKNAHNKMWLGKMQIQ